MRWGAHGPFQREGHADEELPAWKCGFTSANDTSIFIVTMSAAAPAQNGANDARDPSGFLSEIIGAPVTVKLNSGVVYRGRFKRTSTQVKMSSLVLTPPSGELQSVDGYMNIALEQTKEFVNGKLRRNYGDAFVRGNNGELSFPPQLLTPLLTTFISDVHFGRLMKGLHHTISNALNVSTDGHWLSPLRADHESTMTERS